MRMITIRRGEKKNIDGCDDEDISDCVDDDDDDAGSDNDNDVILVIVFTYDSFICVVFPWGLNICIERYSYCT